MDKQRIRDLVGLVAHDQHQLRYFLTEQYTEAQLEGVGCFRNAAFDRAPRTKQEAVDMFVRHVPGRGERDLLAMFRAMKADGWDGPVFNRVLGA